MLKWIGAVICLVTCYELTAQRFGGTPPSIKWKQINTDSARVIFPAGLDSQAQRVAYLVHQQAAAEPVSLGEQLKKINIVLQNQTTIANGYVGLGPYRSEFYLTPGLNNFDQGSIGWADGLTIHEYRHVQQFNNFRNGISKLAGVLFGEEGYALAVNASVPDWFYEGDAVYTETILSRQGRGRLPLFMNTYPSIWEAGKEYSWMKLRNGSWKDYVPSHYNLGYLLVNYGYEKYGLDFWGKVTRDASAFKGLIYPFQHAIKKHAGVSYQSFREAALNYYRNSTVVSTKNDNEAIFPVNKKYVTNRIFPYQVSEDSLIYLKTSYRHRPAFFIKHGKGENRLRIKDISLDDQFSYRNGKIVYTGFEKDARWSWRDYSVIKVLDIHSGKQRTITHRTKYFSPDISPSGRTVAAVEITAAGKSELHLVDASTGELNKRVSMPDVNVFTDPKFIAEDSLVTAVRMKDGRMALVLVDLRADKNSLLTSPSFHVIGYPSVSNNTIFYTATYEGSDNIFALRLTDKKIFRITEGIPGQYFVNAKEGKLTWSAFSAEGYQLQQMDAATTNWQPVSDSLGKDLVAKWPVSNGNTIHEILSAYSSRNFPVTSYKKSTRLLNFHSWRPYYEDPEFTFSLYGQNVLNTLETELYYLYNQNDNTNAVGFSAVYGGWFPHLRAGTQYTFNRVQSFDNKIRNWDQLDTRVGISIPLSISSGRSFKNFNVSSNYGYRTDIIKGAARQDFENTNFSYLNHAISFSQQVQTAVQHIFPRLGYALSGQYNHAITQNTSWQFLGTASLFLPGVASTHNLVLTGAWQETDTANALFSNRFSYSRGYNEAYFSRMWRGSANYHFPIVYPDWGFANVLYLHRIRANGFFDFTRVYSNDKTLSADQRSAGGEIYVDTKWWNQYELSFGFRVSRLLDNDLFTGTKATVFEFILPVSILPR